MYFYVDLDYFGKVESKPLVEGGMDLRVTNENKLEYLEKLGFFKMYINIKEQVDAFLKGFHELIPKNLVSIFSH
jgi:E3 ubiquitin-protein ligase HUWE1